MRIVEHPAGGPHKLLRIEAEGCAVHIVVGLHSPDGTPFTSVEIEPAQPADDGHVWQVCGSSTVMVVDTGPQVFGADCDTSARRGVSQYNGAKSVAALKVSRTSC